MAVCPTCQRELDEASARAGRCAACGSVVRQLPQRTIADVRLPPLTEDPHVSREDATIDLSDFDLDLDAEEGAAEAGVDAAARTTDNESLATMEFAGESVADVPQKPLTVTFNAEQTVEFLGGMSDPDVTMLTSQWQGAAGSPADSRATIKQKETLTGSFMSSSSLVVKSRNVRPTGVTASPIMSPADAPDYELLNVIGEGGMGVVYAARQSSIARTVAVKMLKGDDANNAAQRDKFISEAVVTGELDHPNIVPIYDLGANDQGALFYSMKRVKGTPWNKVLKEKSLDENLTILLRMADAVAFAHVNGVIHRDLKPENVMLGDFGEVLVMDWGLARVSPEFPNAASVSQSDAMGGTPAYMAPEMATGPLEKITTASDVYLLGAILYEIITGRPPHSGKTVMACLFAAAKNQIVAAEQSGELMDVALKAMATESSQRHGSVPEFQRAIRRYQSHSESIKLTESAERNLVKAAETKDYEVYARALYGLEESLALWPGNKRAAELLKKARLDYARLALAKGDFDLGASLLDPKDDSHGEVLKQLETGRRERESRKRWVKLLKGAVAALLLAVGGIVSVAYVKVSQQRDRAVKAEGEATANAAAEKLARQDEAAQRKLAEENEDKAIAAKEEADANAEEARKQEGIANVNAEEARKQEKIAIAEAKAAEEARQEETKAKERQEYEAYVARIGLAKSKIDENAFDRAAELLAQCKPELRDWEWGRLSYLCQLAEHTWRAAAPVDAAAFSPDGVHFATGDWEGDATIWNRQTGERERQFPQGQYVHSVAYDATGDRLAAGSSDGSVKVYRASDGQVLADLPGHAGAVLSVRFSPDGSKLLTSSRDQTARLWDLATNELLQTLHEHSWWVWSAEFSPDGEDVVTAGQDGKAIVWRRGYRDPDAVEAANAEPPSPDDYGWFTEFTSHKGPVYSAKFSPDGKLVATAGYDGRVLLWEPVKVKPVDVQRRLVGEPDLPVEFREFAGHRAPVKAVAFAPDGKSLAAGGQDNVVIIWDAASGAQRQSLRGHASYVASCEFSRDGEQLLTAGRDGLVKLWRPAAYAETLQLDSGDGVDAEAVLDARFSPDGASIVTAGRDRTAALWDAKSLERMQAFQEGHDFLATSAVFFDDGARLATGAGDGTVRVWDVVTGAEVLHYDGTGRTAALDVSDDGALLATGSADESVQIWDADSGEKLAVLPGHQAEVTAVRFAPGGRLLASGDDRGHCRLWRRDEAGNWTGGARLDGHSREITAMAFVDGDARLITASGDNTCGQWDVAAGRELRDRVLKHPDWVADMIVSRDGRLALTCCDDGQLRLWSLDDGRVVRTMRPRSDKTAFTSIDMTADGRLAAAACAADGSVRLWDLSTGEEATTADAAGKARPWLDLSERGGLVWAARFAPDGQRLLAIGGNDAQMFDLDSRNLSVRFSPHGAVASASVSPDGTRVVTGSWDRSAKIWDAQSGQVIAKLDGQHEGYVNSAVFSPDGTRVLTASDDGTARLWDAADGRPLDVVFRGHQDRVRAACFSPDGARVLTVSNDKTAIVSDAATGEPLLPPLTGHEWALRSGAFSADGRRVITGGDDNTAIVWDAVTGARIGEELRGHTGGVTSVALSADGARALTGSEDNAVKLWDADTAKEILTLSGHADEVTAVSFSPDGRRALSSGRDGRTILWPSMPWAEAPAQQASR